MKNTLFLSLILLPTFTSFAVELLPADHAWCLDAALHDATQRCEAGKKFYVDQNKRCGCLAKSEFYDPKFCARANIRCDINHGKSYSSLQRLVITRTRSISKRHAGCGCFSTAQGTHAVSTEN